MAKAFSPERRVASLVDRLRIWVSITCSTPSPAPRTYTGFLAQSLARSARVMTTAPPASVTRQMFKTLKGQTTGRESSTSCTVIGSRFLALGLRAAHLRVDTATCAHCSRVVPYSCMWRVVMRPNMVGAPPKPYGVPNGIVDGLHVQAQLALVGQRAELVALVDPDDAGGAGELSHPGEVDHRAPPAGWNMGRLISSVSFSKTTSTGMSHVIAFGSGTTLTRLVMSRVPSSSSTMARVTGGFTLKALFRIWWAISNE